MSNIDREEILLDTVLSTKFSQLSFISMCSLTALHEYKSSGFMLSWAWWTWACSPGGFLPFTPTHADFYDEGIEPENPDQVKMHPFLIFSLSVLCDMYMFMCLHVNYTWFCWKGTAQTDIKNAYTL